MARKLKVTIMKIQQLEAKEEGSVTPVWIFLTFSDLCRSVSLPLGDNGSPKPLYRVTSFIVVLSKFEPWLTHVFDWRGPS